MTYFPEDSKVVYRSKDGKEEKIFDAVAKREVGAILNRRHINKYVEDQNREIPPRRDSKAFKAAVGVYCTIWVKG